MYVKKIVALSVITLMLVGCMHTSKKPVLTRVNKTEVQIMAAQKTLNCANLKVNLIFLDLDKVYHSKAVADINHQCVAWFEDPEFGVKDLKIRGYTLQIYQDGKCISSMYKTPDAHAFYSSLCSRA